MQIVRDTQARPAVGDGTAVTIGAYDGLHLGHRAVIERVRSVAAERGLASAVVTFDRHPASVVRPESAPKLLCDLDQKLELLESTGIDIVVVVTFDELRASETAEEFVQEVLVDCLRARSIIVGEDFHFGKGRGGNVELLDRLGPGLGFDVLGMDLVGADGRPAATGDRVSSTAIRRAIAEGDLASASAMLGRHHEVRGVVAHGDARGRELGFPTANVSVPGSILLPADGIYAGWFERPVTADAPGAVLPTAISLGRRPTFYETADASLLEAHVLDFSGDLYDEAVAVRFVERIRGEVKFDSVEALVDQIGHDCDDVRVVLGRPDQSAS
ncbi:bifunctional riboflavin kinase/FAD synthetase [Actinospongicola halichondriae]|uniref:bifunctional riboflavin kinase/FAD synthetase n=1 Tax=Actinospongicola halichondriae TaxID=3236844 RepID=UPI003D386F36